MSRRPEREIGSAIEGDRDAAGLRVAIVVSRFHADVAERLLAGAEACLDRHGCGADARTVARVPGAWELPFAVRRLAAGGEHDAVVALGALVRGETPHFEVIAHEVARGLGRIALEYDVPVTFGVLTTNTLEQALARAGDGSDNKGWEAALAAIECANLARRLEHDRAGVPGDA
jgi:6,7-dimethyl-8-ribityllumazine synthase